MSDISEKVKLLISEHLSVPLETLKNTDSILDDLGADSLDTVELIMSFEEEFQIEIPDDVAEGINTVGDAIKCIEAATIKD
jgi:acyl carrier protein